MCEDQGDNGILGRRGVTNDVLLGTSNSVMRTKDTRERQYPAVDWPCMIREICRVNLCDAQSGSKESTTGQAYRR